MISITYNCMALKEVTFPGKVQCITPYIVYYKTRLLFSNCYKSFRVSLTVFLLGSLIKIF